MVLDILIPQKVAHTVLRFKHKGTNPPLHRDTASRGLFTLTLGASGAEMAQPETTENGGTRQGQGLPLGVPQALPKWPPGLLRKPHSLYKAWCPMVNIPDHVLKKPGAMHTTLGQRHEGSWVPEGPRGVSNLRKGWGREPGVVWTAAERAFQGPQAKSSSTHLPPQRLHCSPSTYQQGESWCQCIAARH